MFDWTYTIKKDALNVTLIHSLLYLLVEMDVFKLRHRVN